MKYILVIALAFCLMNCAKNTEQDYSKNYTKTSLAQCQGIADNSIAFKALISKYTDNSYVLETWVGPNNQYFIGYVAPNEYKGFFDFYVGNNVVIIRHFEQLLSDVELAGNCQKL